MTKAEIAGEGFGRRRVPEGNNRQQQRRVKSRSERTGPRGYFGNHKAKAENPGLDGGAEENHTHFFLQLSAVPN